MKIIEKINHVHENGGTTISFEFFPAKTEAGVFNLLNRVEEMGFQLQPTFVTLTWRSAFKNEDLWLKIGSHIQNEFGIDVLLHLTCHLPKSELIRILDNARKLGICNILALRGDPPIGSDVWEPVENGLKNAVELIKLIREKHGEYFCIACAGYPEVHTESWNNPDLPPSQQARDLDLVRLLEKQNAGADFIITQFFFDVDNVVAWMQNCKDVGIHIPILPGYLPIQNFNSFKKFTDWCKTVVPPHVSDTLTKLQNDDAAVKKYGVQLAVETCRKIQASGGKSLHFYTMNLAATVTKILRGLDLIPSPNAQNSALKNSAFKSSRYQNRYEEVRPIFWANRESSYISRTSEWDEFPNGRWGNRKSPAFGELSEYYLAFKRPKVDRKVIWGFPECDQDVWQVFVRYIEGNVRQLPWCEQALAGESMLISENLRWINSLGFLTINSQPRVNGAPSSDAAVGWGGQDGYVFQKAYIEFFTSPEQMKLLLENMPQYPNLSYHAVNLKGDQHCDTEEDTVNAVTWGIFPGKEVLQPTVVDSSSFLAWKKEAFELWMSQWASVFDQDSTSYKVVSKIHNSYYLVNIVDNDYTNENGDIFAIFKKVITDQMSKEQLQIRVNQLDGINQELREAVTKLQSLQVESATALKQCQAQLADALKKNDEILAANRDMQTKLAVPGF